MIREKVIGDLPVALAMSVRKFVGRGKLLASLLSIGIFFGMSSVAHAADEIDTGDTAWMIVATCLVLFMTIPGLSLFYAGLVRSKNVLSV